MNLYDYITIGAGAVASGVAIYQYATGGWPFEEFPEYGWYIVESWRERIATPKEGPDTHTLIRPFYRKKLDKDGNPIVVPKGVQEEEIPNLKFLSAKNYQGTLTLEYRWFVDTPEGANDFYFRSNAEPDQIDNFIKRRTSQLLAGVDPKILGSKQEELSQSLYLYFDGGEGEKGLLYEKTGVHLDSLSISEVQWDPKSWEVLMMEEKANKEVAQQATQSEGPVRSWDAIYARLKKSSEEKGYNFSDEELIQRTDKMYDDQRIFEYTQNSAGVILDTRRGDYHDRITPIPPRSSPQSPSPNSQNSSQNDSTESPQEPRPQNLDDIIRNSDNKARVNFILKDSE
ncbi:MAG: hypothetical protein PVJ67_02025 [Candidatus Pacearchaeota archaeon]|jgi:hypothetical protein